ncbi:hypothetical protein EJ06DRAFT_581738 [Trichodelitschia bisporula]|uniref:Uncharacterized protein n=1 Tax=Trichodelitschia bisporula TaxID=703511 RepID=A0A6G1HX90_9PEZI|nr:hypothetical protein EJ06DRAFT_581738 [Trichodelitschia bisporula]
MGERWRGFGGLGVDFDPEGGGEGDGVEYAGGDEEEYDDEPFDPDMLDEANALADQPGSEESSVYGDGEGRHPVLDSPTIRAAGVGSLGLLVPEGMGTGVPKLALTSPTLNSMPRMLEPVSPVPREEGMVGNAGSQASSMLAQLPPQRAQGHARSGSDSVAYVRERVGEGEEEFRWVLERRRTGSDGVESVVGRVVVEGGRI